MTRIVIKSIALALIVSSVSIVPAQAAYVDPGSGGQLFQLLAILFGLFSAILLFLSSYIKMALARSKRLLRGFFARDPKKLHDA